MHGVAGVFVFFDVSCFWLVIKLFKFSQQKKYCFFIFTSIVANGFFEFQKLINEIFACLLIVDSILAHIVSGFTC